MSDGGVGLNLRHLLQDLNGFVSPSEFGSDHSQGVVSTKVFRRTAEREPKLLFGFSVLAVSGQHQAEVYVRRGIIWPPLNRRAK